MAQTPDSGSVLVSYSFVAYLDMLGQSDKLRRLERLPRSKDEERQIINTLAKTALNVRMMREQFSLHFQGGLLKEESIPAHRRHIMRRLFGVLPRLRGFSDSVVITVPLTGTEVIESVAAITAVQRALLAVAAVQTNFLANSNSPVRGGIDVGLGIDIYEGEYYGRALVEAYLLESEEADYPRVLVGPGLTGYLGAVEQAARSFEPDLAHFAVATIQSCRELLLADPEDQRLAVDPMAVALFEDGSGSDRGAALCQAAVSRTQSLAQSFKQDGNVKLASRYERLERSLHASPHMQAHS